ncbi:V-type ATP synthase subunit D [Candidatus Woesearchaeota archaeon]|nr:MAG: V-type ATP synthase subunit D [Candidatus Woesearchaeota archaeon]
MGSKTRSDLLEVKHKTALAKRGHSLLKKKQDVLINKFFTLVQEYKSFKKDIVIKTRTAYKSLSLDIAYTGIFSARAVSYAMPSYFDISFEEQNIMGVRIPNITVKKKEGVEASYQNSPQLAEAAKMFQHVFEDLIKLASLETTLLALADEIKKVKRRVNALEHIQIPNLEQEQKDIRFALEEQEREGFMRLKVIKNKLQSS